MPKNLIQRLRKDSVAEFEAAALARFQDGIELEARGRPLAAIYLWGYAAEMTLKAAYFRLIGFTSSRVLTFSDLRAATVRALTLAVSWPPPHSFHYLPGWADLIVQERIARRIPLPLPVAAAHISHSRALHLCWRETLRYHDNRAYDFEVQRAAQSLEWFLANYAGLWR